MRLTLAATAFLLFIEQASLVQGLQQLLPPSNIVDVSKAFSRSDSVEKEVRRDAHLLLHRALYQRNAIASPSPNAMPQIISDPTLLTAASAEDTWNTTTGAACLKTLEATTSSGTNSCGMTACYNIKYLNTTTGAFQTDLRLYRTSAATGDWASADSKSFSVGIMCDGASMTAPEISRRNDDLLSWPPIRRYIRSKAYFKRSTAPPQLLQQISFYGKMNENIMENVNDGGKVRSYLAPTITVSGKANNGKSLEANLSTDKTSFVAGVLADQVPLPATSGSSPALISTSPSATSTPAKATKFILPGKTLGIFPVGLVITSVWTLLFLGTVCLGTIDRIRFREAYRRRMKRETGKDVARI